MDIDAPPRFLTHGTKQLIPHAIDALSKMLDTDLKKETARRMLTRNEPGS
jgi:hypothetical protein